MSKLRLRLMLAVLVMTLVVLSSLGLVIGQVFKEFYFNHLTAKMTKEANLAALTVFEPMMEGDAEDVQSLAEMISEKLDARTTLIQADGTVIGESAADPSSMENHLMRPEIQSAIRGDEQSPEIRYSTTVEAELVYYAVPLVYEGETFGYIRLGIPFQELNKINQRIWLILMISFSFAFAIIIFITYRVSNQMIRPVEEATRVANELTKGNFKARTFVGRNDEIGQLSRSINVLANNLDQVTKRHQIQKERLETLIENMGSGLILINARGDVTLVNRSCKELFQKDTTRWLGHVYHQVIEHKEVIKVIQEIFMTEKEKRSQLKLSIRLDWKHFDVYGAPIISDERLKGVVLVFHDITELKNLEQVRKDFVANVSHELKTPVTSIRGFTETLLDGAMENSELREKFLTIVHKESARLQSLITDLLELSRIEQQYFILNRQQIDVAEIIKEVIYLLKPQAEAKDVKLIFSLAGDTHIEGDPARIKQIVINLVTNSIMYTPTQGEVSVTVTEQTDDVIFEVADTGIGIVEEEIPRIFERFYRVDRARSRNSGGTGLGLAIVKHLVEAHHGKIFVDSKSEEGTTFTIHFPKKQEQATLIDK